jgi:phospholipase C
MKYSAFFGCLAAILAVLATSAFADSPATTATPIKHLVVIFQENVSFDHYFGTYPTAQNNPGETPFAAKESTPKNVNTLLNPLDASNNFLPLKGLDLIAVNPNGPLGSGAKINGADASNPFRLSPAQALTSDQGHNDLPEQLAADNGKMDAFPKYTGRGGTPAGSGKDLVMGYYDGNTVTALWNYAQNFAMSDNFRTTTFGPSTPGALNLISGQSSVASTPR